jgi:hypothetical protein
MAPMCNMPDTTEDIMSVCSCHGAMIFFLKSPFGLLKGVETNSIFVNKIVTLN